MSFIDALRSARRSRVSVLHEFWLQYDPSQKRVHAFFEGHDDVAFFSFHIERAMPKHARLCTYRCEGKARVYEAFGAITARIPDIQATLFFVDKDLDDILGRSWPTDPRIFVTDVYSVENYLVTSGVLSRLLRDAVRLTRVEFDEALVVAHFEQELARFHRRTFSTMAWILEVHRARGVLNLQDVDLSRLASVSDQCEVAPVPRRRLLELERAAGATPTKVSFRRLMHATREIARMPPKRVIRGKFEAWFFVSFWRRVTDQLRTLAKEEGGKLTVKLSLENGAFCVALKSYADTPRSLALFLGAHFPASHQPPPAHESSRSELSLLSRLRRALGG